LKLHLGCGQNYLDGYTNIDYPSSEHTVQDRFVADRLEDITELRFDSSTIYEVRLHHVFEHFRRSQAAAMIACWNSWLVDGGKLHIEVPDLGAASQVIFNPFSCRKAKAVAERHLFGSQEAKWAIHYEAYDKSLMGLLLNIFGFEIINVRRTIWKGTHNLHVIGKKVKSIPTSDNAIILGREYLKNFLVDQSDGEMKMIDIWMDVFQQQLNSGWAEK
jgi:hypothetical protein